ncbi:Collagen triple helix repeat (20 copies) [uncultured archaeon]|nr:Collagen triple helix repeat (20 copies) [uncultured archaeon]
MAEFHSMPRRSIPATGTIGDVYYANDTKELFFAIGAGGLVSFASLLTTEPDRVGPQGPDGQQGPKGDTGQTGPQGPQGLTGPPGQQGPPGAQGVSGQQGPQGDVGPAGPAGPIGAGVAGPAGPTGPQGPTGPTGPQGQQGDSGPRGPQGDQGIQGVPGTAAPLYIFIQGNTGPQGPKGDTPGMSDIFPAVNFASVSVSASGATTVVAAVTGKKIRVVGVTLSVSNDVNLKWQSHVAGDITGLIYAGKTGGFVLPYSPVGHFETAVGEALDLNLSAGVPVGGSLSYYLI